MKIELRPTTQADVDAFLKRPSPYRIRAYTGWADDQIKGIGGVAYLPDGTAMAFLELADDARRYAVTLHKAALKTIAEAQANGIRKIVAQADPKEPTAERWLRRLGFEPMQIEHERVWLWHS